MALGSVRCVPNETMQQTEGDNMWEQARRSHCTRAAPGLVGEVFRMDALKNPRTVQLQCTVCLGTYTHIPQVFP